MPVILDLSSSAAVLPRKIVSQRGAVLLPPYLTVEEEPSDQVTITQHPVDTGASMSDHIFLRPPELKLRLGWSNSDVDAGGDAAFVRNVYASILRIKNARQLVGVYTGKRYYTNMFPVDIRGPRTDHRSEWAIIVDILFRQLLLVNTSSRPNAPANTAAANNTPSNLANPEATQPTTDTGYQQVTIGPSPDIRSELNNLPNSPSVSSQTNSNDGAAGPTTADFDF